MALSDVLKPKSEIEILSHIKTKIDDNIISINEFLKNTGNSSRDERRLVKKLKPGQFNYVLDNFWDSNFSYSKMSKIINRSLNRKTGNRKPSFIKFKNLRLLNFESIGLVKQMDYYSPNETTRFWLLKTKNLLWEDGIQL